MSEVVLPDRILATWMTPHCNLKTTSEKVFNYSLNFRSCLLLLFPTLRGMITRHKYYQLMNVFINLNPVYYCPIHLFCHFRGNTSETQYQFWVGLTNAKIFFLISQTFSGNEFCEKKNKNAECYKKDIRQFREKLQKWFLFAERTILP